MLALPEQAPPGMRMTRKADSLPHLGSLAVRSGWAVTRSAWRSSPCFRRASSAGRGPLFPLLRREYGPDADAPG